MFRSIKLIWHEIIRVVGATVANAGHSLLALILAICCLVGCCWLCTLLWGLLGRPFAATAKHIGVIVSMEIASIYILVLSLSALLAKKEGKSFLESIAGKPASYNWCWQGGRSLFTLLVLHTVRKLRQVSALQLAKAFYRWIARRSAEKKNALEDIDVGSKRSNVSPFFQESYVLLWGVFLSLQLFLGGASFFVFVALDVYFIVESTTWILYYSVFRRFFEENYSVYHVMEHLPIVLFMIPFQAIAYSLVCLYGEGGISDLWRILPVLLGQASNHYVIFSIMGFIYSALVVSIIVSTFPVERIKVSNPRTFVVGAGDVVCRRLYNALNKYNMVKRILKDDKGNIDVYTREAVAKEEVGMDLHVKDKDGKDVIKPFPVRLKSIYELIVLSKGLINQSGKNVVAWIETPADTHLYYLELLKDHVALVVVEKPMVCSKSDLARMREIVSSDYRSRIFFLSYYVLEKALMLTFLRRPNSFYLRYFDEKAMGRFYQAYLELGKLKRITVEIIEGADQRHLPNGGQLVETFVHNCLIASLFAGLPDTWKGVSIKESDDDANIELKATGEFGEEIYLVLIKKDGCETRQFAELEFEEGCIEADLYNRTASVRRGRDDSVELTVKDIYKERYAILCDMVYECYFNQIDPSSIDGLYHQVEVLEWLLASCRFKDNQ